MHGKIYDSHSEDRLMCLQVRHDSSYPQFHYKEEKGFMQHIIFNRAYEFVKMSSFTNKLEDAK